MHVDRKEACSTPCCLFQIDEFVGVTDFASMRYSIQVRFSTKPVKNLRPNIHRSMIRLVIHMHVSNACTTRIPYLIRFHVCHALLIRAPLLTPVSATYCGTAILTFFTQQPSVETHINCTTDFCAHSFCELCSCTSPMLSMRSLGSTTSTPVLIYSLAFSSS